MPRTFLDPRIEFRAGRSRTRIREACTELYAKLDLALIRGISSWMRMPYHVCHPELARDLIMDEDALVIFLFLRRKETKEPEKSKRAQPSPAHMSIVPAVSERARIHRLNRSEGCLPFPHRASIFRSLSYQ